MGNLFLYSAAIGGTLLVAQFLLLMFGFGGDSDVEHGHLDSSQPGHDQAAFLKLFSLQTASTFLTFFGLCGLGTMRLGWSPLTVAVVASAAGVAALWFVGKLMQGLARLQSQGNVDLGNAIGRTGSVYLRIPPAGGGPGRVLMQVQGRTVECAAISGSGEIATGAQVRVVARTDDDVLVVEPVL
jgi:membrane protein implicated in regulation of membrane protease activity